MSGKRHLGRAFELGYRTSDSSILFTSNEDGNVFFDYVIVVSEKSLFLRNGGCSILSRRMRMVVYFLIM